MKLYIIESTTGIQREFQGGNENMSVNFFVHKIAEQFNYDRKRMKVLFQA